MDNKNQSRSEAERLQQENPNPGSLSVTDEKQRTAGRSANDGPQQMPIGNEQSNMDTQGTVAGVGE